MLMAKKKKPIEEDIARLKKKIAERKAKTGKVLGDGALRVLRKRLKREQRKRRALAQRLAHAQGKKKDAQPAAATAAPAAAAS
jgi:predicted  nucleic acid-binding Zn-ribbon protein